MKKARSEWGDSHSTPTQIGRRSRSVTPSGSPSSGNPSETVNTFYQPKYLLEGENEIIERQIEQSIPPSEPRKDDNEMYSMRPETDAAMKEVLSMMAEWNSIDQNALNEAAPRTSRNWVTDTAPIWMNREMTNFLTRQSIPGQTTRHSEALSNQYEEIPAFISYFLHGSYDDCTKELESVLTLPCNSKSPCEVCRSVGSYHYFEIIFTQPLEKISKFFSLIPPHCIRHLKSMFKYSMSERNSFMLDSLLSAGFSEQVLKVLSWYGAPIDPFCQINGKKTGSLLTHLIEIGAKNEIIMQYQRMNLFNAIDVEEAELKAIQMNRMDLIQILSKLRSHMAQEMKELDDARNEGRTFLPTKWNCSRNEPSFCAFNLAFRNIKPERRLSVAAEYADGEVLNWVLDEERKRMSKGKHPYIDAPDKYLYTPLMHAVAVGNEELVKTLIKEFGAGIAPEYKGNISETVWTVAVQHDRFTLMGLLVSIPRHRKELVHLGFPLERCVKIKERDNVLKLINLYRENGWLTSGNRSHIGKEHVNRALFAAMMKKDLAICMELVGVDADMTNEKGKYQIPFDDARDGWREGASVIEQEIKKAADHL